MWFEKSEVKVLRKLGEGLNSEVYLAQVRQADLAQDFLFALKVLKNTTGLDHFKKECENLLSASGKHLVAFRGWHHFEGRPALVLDYIDGVTVYDLIKACTLSHNEALYIKDEVQAGLQELSDARLFHGDLSLKNIMVSQSGEVKLIDFGLTTWKSQRIEASPQFLCPEILNGASPSLKTDLFSLNKIYELILEKCHHTTVTTSPKLSLSQKVSGLKLNCTEKLGLKENPPSTRFKKTFAVSALLIFVALSFFSIKPPAHPRSFHVIEFRSADWLAVRLSSQEPWCFTPCKLKLRPHKSQLVFWRGAHGTGSFYYFPVQQKETLQLTQSDLK